MPQPKAHLAKEFIEDLARTRELFSIFVLHGFSSFDRNTPAVAKEEPAALRSIDKWDLTAFLFFEAAAKFEGFCMQAFTIEVKRWYEVTATRADFVMGSSDAGTQRTFGWADPKRLNERGKNLFPKDRFFGDFFNHIGSDVYNRLIQAHKIRNRIAHDPGVARESITKLASQLHVPKRHQIGLSTGRLLFGYPVKAASSDKYFFVFLRAYENCARTFGAF